MAETVQTKQADKTAGAGVEAMAKAGMHFGALRSRRHPSTKAFVYGSKGRVEMIDLEKNLAALEKACQFMAGLEKTGRQVLFVGTKNEAREALRTTAEGISQPWVTLRWIGGTLTNFDQIRKRVDRLLSLEEDERAGGFARYTKKERLLLGKEMKDLERMFGGILEMKELPATLVVIDSGKEATAVAEASQMKIPVIALANTDCDISALAYPVVGNDKSQASITIFLRALAGAYKKI